MRMPLGRRGRKWQNNTMAVNGDAVQTNCTQVAEDMTIAPRRRRRPRRSQKALPSLLVPHQARPASIMSI